MNSDLKFIILLIISIIFFVIYLFGLKINKDKPEEIVPAIGTIQRINQSDSGYKWFYVSFVAEGNVYTAQTEEFLSVPDDVDVGDQVQIGYYFSKKNIPNCIIQQEGYKSSIYNDLKPRPWSLYASIVFFALFAVCLVKYFIA